MRSTSVLHTFDGAGRSTGVMMLFAVVLGIMLGVVATTLVRQWLGGALTESVAPTRLSAAEFPRLAPPERRRPMAARPSYLTRRAA